MSKAVYRCPFFFFFLAGARTAPHVLNHKAVWVQPVAEAADLLSTSKFQQPKNVKIK